LLLLGEEFLLADVSEVEAGYLLLGVLLEM
jgi:hypothetical protein